MQYALSSISFVFNDADENFLMIMFALAYRDLHRVPKLATPLASNTLNSVWSSWISTKYRTLHYLNITYCREQVYKVKVNDVDELRQRIQSPDCIRWTWPAYYVKAIKQWRTHLRAYVEAKGGHFEYRLWRLVQNDRLHECFTFCKKICQVLTLLHQLICRGVPNFGTRCSLFHYNLLSCIR